MKRSVSGREQYSGAEARPCSISSKGTSAPAATSSASCQAASSTNAAKVSCSARLCMRAGFCTGRRAPLARTRTCSPAAVLRDDRLERRRLRRLSAGAGGAEPFRAVRAHGVDARHQRATLLGQLVLHARRDLREGLSRDDAFLLERAQAEAQRPRRDALERALELAEAATAIGQITDHE